MDQARDLCAPPALGYLRHLTTDLGIWQHATGKRPAEEHGYSLDDIARALIAVNHIVARLPALNVAADDDPRTLTDLAEIYLRAIERVQRDDGRFHNFTSAGGVPTDAAESPDAFGRAVWALGDALELGITPDHRQRAAEALRRAQMHVRPTPDIRASAFLLLGVSRVSAARRDSVWVSNASSLLASLLARFEECRATEWRWCEDSLRYSNGAIPFALFVGADTIASADAVLATRAREAAKETLDFLLRELQVGGVPSPIGNRGWYTRGQQKALFDQQPVDAAAMAIACLEAWRVTRATVYRAAAERWLRWYDGDNVMRQPLLDDDGAVHDGIDCDRVVGEGTVLTPLDMRISENCGAESVITYLLARIQWIEECCGSKEGA